MNQQDKSFMITFTTVMSVLVLIAVVIFMVAQLVSVATVKPDDGIRRQAATADRIKPVGQVAVAGAPAPAGQPAAAAAPPKAASGKDVYNSACAACHAAGVLNAPKLGSKEAWATRYEKGLDALVASAIKGVGAMPAKGGNPALSDEEIRVSVEYMLTESGIEVAAAVVAEAAPALAPAAPTPTVEAAALVSAPPAAQPAAAQPDLQQALAAVQRAVEAAQKATEAAKAAQQAVEAAAQGAAPAAPAAEPAAPAPAKAEPAAAAPAPAEAAPAAAPAPVKAEPAAAAPAPAEAAPAAAPAPVKAEPAAAAPAPAEAAPAAAPAPVKAEPAAAAPAPAKAEPTAAPAPAETAPAAAPAMAPVQEAAAVVEIIIPENVNLVIGKQVYSTACVICHQAGVAGAPKLGDQAAWAPRLSQGFDTLVEHSVKGFKGMPPKGGRLDLSNGRIIAAVGYMVSEAK